MVQYQTIRSFDGTEEFVLPRKITLEHVRDCTLLPDRYCLLEYLPKRGCVAEIGSQKGDFAKFILEVTQPCKFHIFDIDFDQVGKKFDVEFFSEFEEIGLVERHEGDSSTEITKLPDSYFDWVYIDGDHSFEGVSRDIKAVLPKMKKTGLLVFNDYTVYSPLEKMQYGVQRAVNDLLIDAGFGAVFFALNIAGYPDICIRRKL